MSPDTLRKLCKWLTLEETASELSTALSEEVDASDVLRLALDERRAHLAGVLTNTAGGMTSTGSFLPRRRRMKAIA